MSISFGSFPRPRIATMVNIPEYGDLKTPDGIKNLLWGCFNS
ncbi:MAG: hypothetical protein ABSF93_05930 [Candidatus Sulfotelmatobacter sp.]